MISKTFDFWMKLVYSVRLMFCTGFIRHDSWDKEVDDPLYWYRWCISYLSGIIIILYFSTIDAPE